MMKWTILLIALLFVLPPQDERHRLVVTIRNIKPIKGDLYLGIHRRAEFFYVPDSAVMKRKLRVSSEAEIIVMEDVPEGRLAIAVYHDENLNGKLDANEIGIPFEGYGFSKNPKAHGRPKFEQAAFDFNKDDSLVIQLIYHPPPRETHD
ncbi:MAG TPA: DUF2141 domain-containing protein [Bacteroidales bacterium]|nr:DUF2141 domain-containing protein [Bacteroidales bacterium]HNS46104.1 DUF2141 domain-containing protein [Bacteroidales bacterium]